MSDGAAGLLVAAPASGSGKTTLTLALLRCLRNRGRAVASVKAGPDYIDPAFHQAASGRPCINLDSWAMRPETLAAAVARAGAGAELLIGEGVMGLFDGAPLSGPLGLAAGSTAEVAALTGWPVVLAVDCKGMGASVAALVAGFAGFHPAVPLAGVILNNVAGARHETLLRAACEGAGIKVFGALGRDAALARPSRHLGLVQAGEDKALEDFLEAAAAAVAAGVDVAALGAAARPAKIAAAARDGFVPPVPPLGQRIAVARDLAFSFAYPLLLDAWRHAGAEVSFFSPLADEAPPAAADAVYLPGGYPELHAGRLAGNDGFLAGLRAAAARAAAVYGECGGYMVLGQGLEDTDGQRHAMAGLLPLESSFMVPERHLGYRRATLLAAGPLGRADAAFRAHEFHYARVLGAEGPAETALFEVRTAEGGGAVRVGQRRGPIFGSFLHLIDGAAAS
ncbi:cobyrinate a,c-diamide synthase [Pelagibius sp. CAU 1746]|uniref:cobyrinate a,c-diamide synthase n=1 Tax=Pelagibius sp. CAU 1746 TaxID=3140370 RepID=UPI00325BEAD8